MKKFLTKRNIIILVVVLLIGGGVWWQRTSAANSQKNGKKVVAVERKDIVETLTVSGKVVAEKSANLNFQSPGKLSFLAVKKGESVKRGTWLMGLDTGDLKSVETKAWYAYLAADANAKLVEDAVKDNDDDENFTQKNTRVAAQTARDSAYENWLSARRAVENSTLKAPFDGVVVDLTTTAIGDTVSLTDGVSVVDPQSLYFEIEIDEADLEKVAVGMKVEVTLDSFRGQVFQGELGEVGFVSQLSSTGATVYSAKVRFPKEAIDKLRLGMNGDAEVKLGEAKGVLALPIEAVVDGEVELENGQKAKVSTGLASELDVEIKAGVNLGDKVVIR